MNKPEDEPISYWDFAWRSMVLPGWGHYYLERPTMGTFYSASTAALLLNVYRTRMAAVNAKKQNDEEVQINFILTGIPSVAPQALRAAYSLEANRRAYTDYQKKVDIYNYSLILLASFYAFQIVHIIYNGIAWENGIPIVENRQEDKRIRFSGFILPESSENKKGIGASGFAGLTYTF
ncbi:MAG: hypothetical protein OEZ34_14730 [Spirochaetia bacterium]|nr:hypothetical protein [Spirochaetia bacterium]